MEISEKIEGWKITSPSNFPADENMEQGTSKFYRDVPDWAKNNPRLVVERVALFPYEAHFEDDDEEEEADKEEKLEKALEKEEEVSEEKKEEIVENTEDSDDVMEEEEKEKKFKCPECGKVFDTENGMKIHQSMVHKD